MDKHHNDCQKKRYRLKCDTPNEATAINLLHSDSTLVSLSTVSIQTPLLARLEQV